MKISSFPNWQITLLSTLLLSIGVLVIFSSSVDLAIQQMISACFGFLLFIFFAKFDYRSLKSLILPAYIFSIILLLIVFVLGIETRGSLRWIPLGFFNIQPSEFVKPALILFLAAFWAKNEPSWRNIGRGFLYSLPVILLIFYQPDLGSTLAILAIWLGMLFGSGVSIKKMLTLFIVFLLIVPVVWFSLHDYQKQRVFGFLTPNSDPLGRGYNAIQSVIAVGSGELSGRGIGRGTQSRLQFLPEFRTDFIFASIAEELGFLGSVIIIVFYSGLFFYLLKIGYASSDTFGYLISLGVVSMLFFQTFVNIGMNIGLLPITGITLPLISYGGSSLVSTFIALGLVASVAKNSETKRSDY